MDLSPRSTAFCLLLIAPILTAVALPVPVRAADDFQLEDGFTSLYNGKDLTGWHVGPEALEGKTESSDGRFAARDGVIVIDGGPKIEDIYTTREFNGDFVLRLEFRAAPRANSGLYLRGKQLQVRDYATIGPYKELKRFNQGGWNAIEVTVKRNPAGDGAVAECTCNGEVLEKALAIPATGGIGLQSETNRIEYRRIRIKGSKLAALIIDGQNNHDWARATRILRSILLASGRFTVDVATSPRAGAGAEEWQQWRPPFDRYDVVVMNFNGGHTAKGVHWPHALEQALEDYVRAGGGLVSYHAANNSFPNWPAYNAMIGLGWRNKDYGPSLVVGSDGSVVEIRQGEGRNPGHGPEHDFVVTVLDRAHPITRGMPEKWLHPHEQLTHGQHGPARNVTVLTYAYSKDTNENEVMDWVIPYGKGRVYTTMLGHLWKNGPDTALRCAGFQTLFARGVEWAATGNVTLSVPGDFPSATEPRLRELDPAVAR
jgi:type 1 glutamine amidotransferase